MVFCPLTCCAGIEQSRWRAHVGIGPKAKRGGQLVLRVLRVEAEFKYWEDGNGGRSRHGKGRGGKWNAEGGAKRVGGLE